MRIFSRFIRDQRGSSFETLALSASVIAITCVAGADLLSYVGRSGELSKTAIVRESRDHHQRRPRLAARQRTRDRLYADRNDPRNTSTLRPRPLHRADAVAASHSCPVRDSRRHGIDGLGRNPLSRPMR